MGIVKANANKARLKGVYVLIIRVEKPIRVEVGGLGELTFNPGMYAYVGSAQNGLEPRVARHKKKVKPLFWHIDYLLNNAEANVTDVYFKPAAKTEECRIACFLNSKATPINGFGCSDCACYSHLFHAQNFNFLREHMQPLN